MRLAAGLSVRVTLCELGPSRGGDAGRRDGYGIQDLPGPGEVLEGLWSQEVGPAACSSRACALGDKDVHPSVPSVGGWELRDR